MVSLSSIWFSVVSHVVSIWFRGSNDFSWFWVAFDGIPWFSIGFDGFAWFSIGFDGFPWFSIGFGGFRLVSQRRFLFL